MTGIAKIMPKLKIRDVLYGLRQPAQGFPVFLWHYRATMNRESRLYGPPAVTWILDFCSVYLRFFRNRVAGLPLS